MADERKLEAVKELAAYRVAKEKFVEEMDSGAMVLEHIKSGARLFLMSNDDDNKVFCIGFRTPPEDKMCIRDRARELPRLPGPRPGRPQPKHHLHPRN